MKLTQEQKKGIRPKLNALVAAYDTLIKGIDVQAHQNLDRAYGGVVRAGKGRLVESTTEQMVRIAWIDVLMQAEHRLEINKKKVEIGIKDSYIERQPPVVKAYLQENKAKQVYKFGTDEQVFIDGKLVLPIECKAYTENAMLKRIIFDANLTKEAYGNTRYYLVQLESMLGGDYCELNDITYGSAASHALMSRTDIDLTIITLLKGERDVDCPIHKAEFFKDLDVGSLEKAVEIFATALEPFKK